MCYHVQYFAAACRQGKERRSVGRCHDGKPEEIYCATGLQEVVGCRTSKSRRSDCGSKSKLYVVSVVERQPEHRRVIRYTTWGTDSSMTNGEMKK